MLALAVMLALYVIGMLGLCALQLELHFRRTRDRGPGRPDNSVRLGAAGLSG